MRRQAKARSRQDRKLRACGAFLCLDYLSTILPSERIAVIGKEISEEFLPFKSKSWRKKKRLDFQSTNVALIVERVAALGQPAYEEFFCEPRTSILRLNARVIAKLDRHPLKHIIS